MSLGLPSHLSRSANARAIATAARWAGLVCLGAAVFNIAVAALRGGGGASSWITLLTLVPMVALLALLARGRTTGLTVAYLLVGAVCTYFYTVALLAANPSYRDTQLFVVALPVVAMTLVGGTGAGTLAGILWATLGFALAEAAVVLAAQTSGRTFVPEAASLGAYLLLVGVLAYDGLTRGVRARPQSALHRAVRDARLVDLRREAIADLAADTHDTVLSDLLAVAATQEGPLPDRLRQRIDTDLHGLGALAAAEVLPEERAPGAESTSGPTSPAGADGPHTADGPWYDSELHRAIEAARDEGLAVDVSGDRRVIGRLDAAAQRAVGLAVRQCLVNVLRHSGSATAEVALSADGDAVSVMVVDAGRGFPSGGTGADRLGLRQSVDDRIARVGGSVTIYSSEDVGTTVIMIVPCPPPERAGGAA
ncbi:ATP-binding protein [Leifsonia sp. F6_8S_P_1B]|uniref:ATP-binding protein n=1 Tax=Leifsonia williamsii TaxID=3035919 RepID=A0ABT8KA56_9MICO|nr:ATP-binding protein [Leifsonia williamsii]MDN4614299.1 ATP-binding protein [Leifsonia williamsii]